MTAGDAPLAKINKRLRNDKGRTIRRGRGAPARANPSIGTVVLTDFLEMTEHPACDASRISACPAFADALVTAGIAQHEINIEERARTALIRLGTCGTMHRGYVWAILFASAAHRALTRLGSPA